VVVGLVVRVLEREGVLVGSPFTRVRALGESVTRIPWFPRGVAPGRLRSRDFGVLLAGFGLVGYVVYLWDRFGEPLAFEQVAGAKGWEQAPGIDTWLKFALGSRIIHPPYGTLDVALVAQGLITLALLLLVPAVIRRFGWGYGAYALVIVLLPAISTKDFGGMGRYGLAAFPCLAVVGLWLEPRPIAARVYLGVSAALMFACLILYSHWVYVS
jgi:hypothetical protein